MLIEVSLAQARRARGGSRCDEYGGPEWACFGATVPALRLFRLAVLDQRSASDHKAVSIEQLPLSYPPGPDGATPAELADRVHRDRDAVQRLLEDLAELGYIDLAEEKGSDEPRAWLTAEGADLVNLTEDTLLSASSRGSVEHTDAY